MLGGTQSEAGHFNYILLMKMCNMHKTQKEQKENDSDSDEDDDDDESSSDDDDGTAADKAGNPGSKSPKLHQTVIKHNGCVNRIKVGLVSVCVFVVSSSLFQC